MISRDEFIAAVKADNTSVVYQYLAEAGCTCINDEYDDTHLNYGDPPLMYAAFYGLTECVKDLIAAGVDIDARNSSGWTALMWAESYSCIDCMQELIAAGADINAKDRMGRTALMRAARNGNSDCVRVLIAAGADVNIKDNVGNTAIILAASYASQGHTDCMCELIAAKADVNAKNNNGTTSLINTLYDNAHYQRPHYDKALLLAEAGADIYANDNRGIVAIDWCGNKRIKAKLIKIANRHIRAAVKSADKPVIIKGFDSEL